MPNRKERILVVGGAGFIGSHICKKLVKLGHEVAIFDLFLQYLPSAEYNYQDVLQYRLKDLIEKGVKINRGDVRYKENIENVIDDFRPSRIIHLAAMPLSNISNVFIDEALESTITSTTNILQIIRKRKFVKRFVYTSSSMVYGDFKYTPADEEHPTNPKDIYGGSKLCGEVMTKTFHNRFGIEYTIVRPSAVYGPSDINQRVSQIFIDNAIKGKEIVVQGGDLKLDFTYVEDVAEGFVLATMSPKGANQTFNITCGDGRSLVEYAEILKKHIPNIKVKVTEADKKLPVRGTLDITKARKLLKYNPQYDLEKGIVEYLKFKNKKI
jgi:UDP-glucose 4-epimerase